MNNIRDEFFDKGFISPLKALDVEIATEIKNKYINFTRIFHQSEKK